jgi:hypothetical protein
MVSKSHRKAQKELHRSCHSDPAKAAEESSTMPGGGWHGGSFAPLPMNSRDCHSERSEESISVTTGTHPDGFFATFRMTRPWKVHQPITSKPISLLQRLTITVGGNDE